MWFTYWTGVSRAFAGGRYALVLPCSFLRCFAYAVWSSILYSVYSAGQRCSISQRAAHMLSCWCCTVCMHKWRLMSIVSVSALWSMNYPCIHHIRLFLCSYSALSALCTPSGEARELLMMHPLICARYVMPHFFFIYIIYFKMCCNFLA